MPYIIGVNRDYFTKAQEEEWRPQDVSFHEEKHYRHYISLDANQCLANVKIRLL
jgi:hypothetical protein